VPVLISVKTEPSDVCSVAESGTNSFVRLNNGVDLSSSLHVSILRILSPFLYGKCFYFTQAIVLDVLYFQSFAQVCNCLQVDEMDVKVFKTEQSLIDMKEVVEQNIRSYSPSPQRMASSLLKVHGMTFDKCLKIAKVYADLYKDEKIKPDPLRHFIFPFIIIECPGCLMSCRSGPSRSSFLKLLLHVSRRHSASSDVVFHDIVERYLSFIEFMDLKVTVKTRRKYLKRLRKLEKRKQEAGSYATNGMQQFYS